MLQRALQAAEGFTPQLLAWIRATPPEAVVEHGLFTRSAEQIAATADSGWGDRRITFVGDAAHPTRPTGDSDFATLLAHAHL